MCGASDSTSSDLRGPLSSRPMDDLPRPEHEALEELRELLPTVLKETGERSEAALNATLGSKNDEFFDLKNDGKRTSNPPSEVEASVLKFKG